jgi:hypothetical protein
MKDGLSSAKGILGQVPGLGGAYRAMRRAAAIFSYRHRHALRLIDSLPPFAPNSGGPPDVLARIALQAAVRTPTLLVTLIALLKGRPVLPITLNEFCLNAEWPTLSRVFTQYGSDKSSTHDYHRLYSEVFTRAGPIKNLLEIGMGTNNTSIPSNMGIGGKPGASLRAFRDVLPDANIFGADIDSSIMFHDDRIVTLVADQTEPEALAALGKKIIGDLDVIIDDGVHAPHANLLVLEFALQKLRRGGWLVIEDIRAEAVPIWQVVAELIGDRHMTYLIDTKAAYVFAMQKA